MLINIPKNIRRSIFKHIQANYSLTPIYWEGQSQRDPNVTYPYIEVRLDGPFLKPRNGNDIHCEFEVNILIHGTVHGDLYEMDEISGSLINSLYSSVDIVDGSGAQLGCAIPITDRRKFIENNQFGIIDPQSELMQSTVEIRFGVTLEIS